MRTQFLGLVLAGNVMAATPVLADVTITMANGNVSVSAKNATVNQILTEWARVGQTRIVNIERVSGAPVTIELVNVPEADALDTVLRSMSGYLAAPRSVPVANASTFDRVFLLPTSGGTPPRAGAPATNAAAPFAAPPQVPGPFQPGPFAPEDEVQRDPEAVRPFPTPRGGPFPSPFGGGNSAVPQPGVARPPAVQVPLQPGNSLELPAPTGLGSVPVLPPTIQGAPSAPFGVSTPGMPVPVPQQQPDRPVRNP
jgi:hypothetical protein